MCQFVAIVGAIGGSSFFEEVLSGETFSAFPSKCQAMAGRLPLLGPSEHEKSPGADPRGFSGGSAAMVVARRRAGSVGLPFRFRTRARRPGALAPAFSPVLVRRS